MDLNQGRFLPNGRCGYVLKPDFLCHPKSNFNPENTGGGPGHIPTQLTIRVSDSSSSLLACHDGLTGNIAQDPMCSVNIVINLFYCT